MGPPELIIIGIVAIAVIFGAKRVPEIARNLGRSSGEFKKGLKEGDEAQASVDPTPQPPATSPTATPPAAAPTPVPPQATAPQAGTPHNGAPPTGAPAPQPVEPSDPPTTHT